MFLNILKNFSLKNKVSKLLSKAVGHHSVGIIKSVGVIFNGNLNLKIENITKELVKHGIDDNQIKVLIFKNKIIKNEVFNHDVVIYKEINLTGEITNSKAKLFLKTNFDLLINYHEFDKQPLIYLSYLSKANFKVVFNTQDKIVNQFMVNTNINNYEQFVDELFKYLKILKKL